MNRSPMLPLRGLSKGRCAALYTGLSLVAVLAAWRLAQVPEFHKDAQYYVQSALLWPSGQVFFSGSLIGARHLVVAYYSLFFHIFGPMGDALSIALAVLFAIHGVCVVSLVALFVGERLSAFLLSSCVLLASWAVPVWDFPASEAPFLAGASLLLLLWVWYITSPSKKLWQYLGIAGVVGVLSRIRPEMTFVLIGVLVTTVFFPEAVLGPLKHLFVTRGRFLPSVLGVSAAILVFMTGSAIADLSWRLWIPAAKPASYRYAFLFWRPIAVYGNGLNGPRSREALQAIGSDPHGKIDYYAVLAATYRTLGPSESDNAMKSIGLESLSANFGSTLKDQFVLTSRYLYLPRPRVEWRRGSHASHRRMSWERLLQVDDIRRSGNPDFGVPEFMSTAKLFEEEESFLAPLRRVVPIHPVRIRLPGVVMLFLLVTFALTCWRRVGSSAVFWLPLVIACLGGITVAAFSQGFLHRYSEPYLILALLAGMCIVLDLFGATRRALNARADLPPRS